jgi:hypothetical protein
MVAEAQRAGSLPAAEPERLAYLLLAVTHGAVDLALAGHLAPDGKGQAAPGDLAEDLLGYLTAAAPARAGRALPAACRPLPPHRAPRPFLPGGAYRSRNTTTTWCTENARDKGRMMPERGQMFPAS